MGVLPDWMIRQGKFIVPYSEAVKREGTISFGETSYGYDATVGYRFRVFSPVNATGNMTYIDPKAFDPTACVEVDLSPVGHSFVKVFEDMRSPVYWRCEYCDQRHPGASIHPFFFEKCPGAKQPADHIFIPPHSFALAETVEHFEIPRDVLAVVLGKSTYARCGLIVNVTPLEPEWKGKVTVELSNTTPLPMKVYAGEGIMQVLFLRTDGVQDAILKTVLRLVNDGARQAVDEHYGQDSRFIQTYSKYVEDCLHDALSKATCEQSYADKKGKYQDQAGLTLPKVD